MSARCFAASEGLPCDRRRLLPLGPGVELDAFVLHDLNDGLPPLNFGDFDYVLLLDVIEHLASPEPFSNGFATR